MAEEINHFTHEDHPMKLIDWESTLVAIKGDDGEEKLPGEAVVVGCDICEEAISVGDSAYACIQCRVFLHKSCSHLPETIHYPSLYHYPLDLVIIRKTSHGFYICYVCRKRLTKGFVYTFGEMTTEGFNACSNCFLVEFVRNAESDAIKEEASVKLKLEGHPQHSLALKLRPASFRCDACKTEEKDLFYECDECDFWIHKTCASLPRTVNLPHHHPKHPLVLVSSLPDNFYKYPNYCKFCNKYIRRDEWLYHCRLCRYFAHTKCTINAQQQPYTLRDDPSTSAGGDDVSSLHFPMAEAFIDPLKLLHSKIILAQNDKETTEISHSSHPDHPLILNVEEPQGNIDCGDPIEVCYACLKPLSVPYYSCKDGCSMFANIHKYCAHLPQTLPHQLHPDHTLHLVDTSQDEEFYECSGCYSYGNTFSYKCETNCNFYLCVNCAFLPIPIKHESHDHPLIQLIDPKVVCNGCGIWHRGMCYGCQACYFHLNLNCAMRSPLSLAHRYCKGLEIPLTYPPVEDHPENFYCDICEEEMDPNYPLYYCHNHKYKSSFHRYCISRIDYYANIWYEGTRTPSYHKHPLTYVRRKKTPKYVCSICNQDINGYLVLECDQAKTCSFIVCFSCHRNEMWCY